MSYETEKLAAELKAAREKKGLSQRALSARAGVPQSHISKIENGGVNLTLSSLTAIANALDLELALVPRKAVPAVKTITRGVDSVPKASPETRKEFARLAKEINQLGRLNIDTSALDTFQRHFRELRQFENLVKNVDPLHDIRKTLKTFESTGNLAKLRDAADQMQSFRNAIAHAGIDVDRPSLPRPAYRLDEDNDE